MLLCNRNLNNNKPSKIENETGTKNSGFVHSQAYVKAIACLVLACGGTLPTIAANETLSNPKVEEAQQSEITVKGTVVDDAGEPVIGATIMEKEPVMVRLLILMVTMLLR